MSKIHLEKNRKILEPPYQGRKGWKKERLSTLFKTYKTRFQVVDFLWIFP